MNSNELGGFSDWHNWDSHTVRKAPNRPGVYAFKLAGSLFGRFKGESDIVYIGCTESANGTISRRLGDHLPTRADVSDVAHRLRDAQKLGSLQVAWKISEDQNEATDEEAKFLRNYYWDHFELPPVNRSEPSGETRVAMEIVIDFIQSDQQFRCSSEKEARELAEKLVKHLRSQQPTKAV